MVKYYPINQSLSTTYLFYSMQYFDFGVIYIFCYEQSMINILNTVLYTYFVSDTKSPVEPLGVPTIFNDTGLQIVNVALRKHFSSCGTQRVSEGITFSPVRQTVYKISFILFGVDFFWSAQQNVVKL